VFIRRWFQAGRSARRGLPLGVAFCAGLLSACDLPVQRKTPKPEPPEVPHPSVEGQLDVDAVLGTSDRGEPYCGPLKPFIVRARASSVQGRRLAAEFAFDADPDTRWSSQFQDAQWLEAYFDRRVEVEQIIIRWEVARAAEYSVEILNTASNWVEIATVNGRTGDTDTIPFSRPVGALGIRVNCHRRATEWGNSIYEVDIAGATMGTPPADNLIGYEGVLTIWERRERGIAERLMAEAAADPLTSKGMKDAAFLDLVARRSFDYLWWETNPENGLTKDRARSFTSSEEISVASIAAVGFALTGYAIGTEREWVTREQALERVLTTLRTFDEGTVRNVRGFFPHFVDLFTGEDIPGTEVSTIDTALFLAGMITAMEYFDDRRVRERAARIMGRVDWQWARDTHPHFVSHGVDADGRFLSAYWGSFTEGLLIYLIGIGSPTHPLPGQSWYQLDRDIDEYRGYRFAIEHGFQSMFRFQYPALWFDFRGRVDRTGLDYFENATRAALAMRQYCIDQAKRFPASYGPDRWGLSAADGPGDRYTIYGFPPGDPQAPTDGTIVPYAIAGSMPFLPAHSLRALRKLYDEHHEAWGKFGFTDSINPTTGFVSRDSIGLDAGTILLGVENERSGFVWEHFMKNRWIQDGLLRIGWRTPSASPYSKDPVDLARDGQWRLQFGDGEFAGPGLDDTRWLDVPVPDRWEYARGSVHPYDGVAWYRVTFGLDGDRLSRWSTSGRALMLTVGGIDDYDEAFVNGVRVGQTKSGEAAFRQPRRYRVPASALQPGRNVVAFRVLDRSGYGGIWYPPVKLGVY